ncbi:MAG TPA: AAA family ATPase [Saprospiraceae bacterium]|nr:AAA family ATPase [Saprospiraceae bacterium]
MRLIKHIKASNLLSFGHNGLDLELRDLNVLIGPNGSGKSNFLEIFEVLRSLPRNEEDSNNLSALIARGGGAEEWKCKANIFPTSGKRYIFPVADFEIVISDPVILKEDFIEHKFSLDFDERPLPVISKESIEEISNNNDANISNYYTRESSLKGFSIWNNQSQQTQTLNSTPHTLSILSQRFTNQGIFILTYNYERIRLYREWSFGRNSIFRTPQRADLRNDRLESDFSNLGMFLSRLRKDPPTKRALVTALQDLYEGITDFEVITEGGTVQIFFTEGDFSIPATRLSDGTLRYLCLVALLLDPNPPPLICIEEPELGLHPDILPKIADLLVEASTRTQLVVTTHSDVLIDALSSQPESVLVCEKHDGKTQIKRLDRADIAHWLEDYRLGQLWTRGEIGGTRW